MTLHDDGVLDAFINSLKYKQLYVFKYLDREILMRFIFFIVLTIFLCAGVYAENDSKESYQKYMHKIKKGFCNIDSIQVSPINISRDTNLDMHALCGNKKNGVECNFYDGLEHLTKQMTKKSELARIIESQYIHEIENKLRIMAVKFPSGKDNMARLDIRTDIRDGLAIDGTPYYSIEYAVTLKELAESHFGREGYMLLDQWFLSGGDYFPEIVTLAEADVAAIKLVPKVVDKMRETFQETREYCSAHNLLL